MALYVPVVRWKRGERVGLRHILGSTKARVMPILVIGPDQFRGREPTASRAALAPETAFAQEIVNDWGQTSCFLDASFIPDSPAGNHALVNIANACAAIGARLIPATRLGATRSYQSAVAAVDRAYRTGVGVRVDLQGMTSANNWIANWPYAPSATDLLVDFSDNVANVAALGHTLDQAFINLHLGGQWRSVSSIGTSMPENFSGFIAGPHTIRRIEFDLWRRLAALGLSYQIDYGDYTTVPVVPPPPGIAWGYPINVKYTLPYEFLVCRGVGTTGLGAVEMDQQLIGHAQRIVAHPNRNRIQCWADDRVDAIAALREPPSNLEHWVRIGVNRHIELTRSILP